VLPALSVDYSTQDRAANAKLLRQFSLCDSTSGKGGANRNNLCGCKFGIAMAISAS
jgi:hypothetical protein